MTYRISFPPSPRGGTYGPATPAPSGPTLQDQHPGARTAGSAAFDDLRTRARNTPLDGDFNAVGPGIEGDLAMLFTQLSAGAAPQAMPIPMHIEHGLAFDSFAFALGHMSRLAEQFSAQTLAGLYAHSLGAPFPHVGPASHFIHSAERETRRLADGTLKRFCAVAEAGMEEFMNYCLDQLWNEIATVRTAVPEEFQFQGSGSPPDWSRYHQAVQRIGSQYLAGAARQMGAQGLDIDLAGLFECAAAANLEQMWGQRSGLAGTADTLAQEDHANFSKRAEERAESSQGSKPAGVRNEQHGYYVLEPDDDGENDEDSDGVDDGDDIDPRRF